MRKTGAAHKEFIITAAPRAARGPKVSGETSGAHRLWRDIMQLMVGAVEEAPQIARGLSDTLLVLDQREADMSFPVLAEAHAWRNGDAGLFEQKLRER